MKGTDFCFYREDSAFSGVIKIADKVRKDVKLVTDKNPEWTDSVENSGKITIIFGTAGKSAVLDQLDKEGIINLDQISNKNEVYSFTVLDDKIIVAGSDKRGTIYGLFHFSELLGVSPLVDWADVLPAHKDFIELENGTFVSKEPSVRFRGFFINDEWPAFGNWCGKNFGGVNAKMYEHVFELLLRLKGNYMWPAMWASRFSDDGPGLENAELADELGVVMGASHHEPCCRAGEEYKYLRGKDSIYGDAWNFRTNRDGITKFWEDGLKRNGKFDNVITVGMRGEADTAILGKNATLKDNIDLLRDVLQTQNQLIKKYVNDDIQQVPRMLALYKEVEPYFYGDRSTKGLIGSPELEGVTLMLCDDNHGNLRTVPTDKMRNHKGGYGMYYHFDYHGSPFSYEWFNTTHLPKVKEQMCAAYDFGIRDLWIVNVGDISTTEFPLSYFLNLAYDYEKYSSQEYTTLRYTADWVEQQFGCLSQIQKNQIVRIIDGYTKLAHTRRTECIWPDTYHPANFNEAERILEKAEEIIRAAQELKAQLPVEILPAYYIQVYLPACGNMNVLKMQLLQGRNHWLVEKGVFWGNTLADRVKECLAFDKDLIAENDAMNNGKFYAMGWSEHFGFQNWNEEENQYPVYYTTDGTRKKRLIVWLNGQETTTCGLDWTRKTLKSKAFRNPETESVYINIAAGCQQAVPFQIESSKNWLTVSSKEGEVSGKDGIIQVAVTIDRKLLASDTDKKAVVKVFNSDRSAGGVFVNIVFEADVPSLNYSKGTFVQTEDYISIEAEHFIKSIPGSTENKTSEWQVLPDYGKTISAVKAFPVTASYKKGKNAPAVEYAFVVDSEDAYSFDFYLNPSNPAYKDNKLQFMVEVNGTNILVNAVDSEKFHVGDNQEPWGTDVTNNIRITSMYEVLKKGLNSIKIYPVTPNVVLEKIVIHAANVKIPESYLGAPETYFVK